MMQIMSSRKPGVFTASIQHLGLVLQSDLSAETTGTLIFNSPIAKIPLWNGALVSWTDNVNYHLTTPLAVTFWPTGTRGNVKVGSSVKEMCRLFPECSPPGYWWTFPKRSAKITHGWITTTLKMLKYDAIWSVWLYCFNKWFFSVFVCLSDP